MAQNSRYPDPPTPKKEEESEQFKASLGSLLGQVQQLPPDKTIRLWFEDEARLGTKANQRRRVTARGNKPIEVQANSYQSYWQYGVFEPATGAHFMMSWSHLDGECFNGFIQGSEQAHKNKAQLHLMVMDNAKAHHAKAVNWPPTVQPIYLPSYCPELNPAERMWQVLRRALKSWYSDIEQLRADVDAWSASLIPFDCLSTLQFPYIRKALSLGG